MININIFPPATIRLANLTYFVFTAGVICALCVYSNPSNANDDTKEMSAEAMKHTNMNHGEMKHENMNHGKLEHKDTKHNSMNHGNVENGDHGHAPVDVASWPSTPSLTLTAYKDAMAGWNLHIEPTHFDFAPEQVNAKNAVGKGHAHLYINGKKITRLYSSWYYLNKLQPGIHSITVSLNANDHGPLVLNNQSISATIELLQE